MTEIDLARAATAPFGERERVIRAAIGDGFSCENDRSVTRDGVDLLTIKRNRNDLAHGRKTFEQVGRDYTSADLLLLTRRSMRYMDAILNNIALYLDQQNYLEAAAAEAVEAVEVT